MHGVVSFFLLWDERYRYPVAVAVPVAMILVAMILVAMILVEGPVVGYR